MSDFGSKDDVFIDTAADEPASRLADPVNQFSISLFHRLSTSDAHSENNVFLSPFSVSTALSMLLLGAKNESAKQLMQGLNLDSLQGQDRESVHALFKDLIESRIKKSESLMLSNYVLIQKDSPENDVLNKFKSALTENYAAKLDDVDFEAEAKQILSTVNQWVRDNTKGLIKTILDKEPSSDTRLILLNAIYFKGKWDVPFNKSLTDKQPFFNNGDNETQVDFMCKYEKSFPYAELVVGGEKSQVVELPYQEDGTSMIIILPNEKKGVKNMLLSKTFAADVANVLTPDAGLSHQTIDLFIPKFKLETEYELNQSLCDMGICDIFGSEADLSDITGRRNLFVSLVKHKAVVKVDEEGTEAAAVTAIQVMMCCAMFILDKKTFRADHPFLFLIKDRKSGLVLFVGKVESL